MKNIIAVGVIVLVVIGIWFLKPFKTYAPQNTETQKEITNSETEKINPEPIISGNKKPELLSKLQETWNLYLLAAKAHNVNELSKYSYNLSYNCRNLETKEKECFASMDTVVSAFKNIQTDDFIILWSDSKQAVLLTGRRPATFEGNEGFYQPRIFFGVKDGSYKVFAVFPDWGVFANKDKIASENIATFLDKASIDTDKDGLTDMEENCYEGTEEGIFTKCKKTDPNNNDENKNGWWDGLEPYLPEFSPIPLQ